MFFGLGWSEMSSTIISLFPTPITMTNIGRDFTETELQLLFYDIPIKKERDVQAILEGKELNHQSKDRYLFDSYSDTLKDIRKFCEQQLKYYLEKIEGADTDLAMLRITQSWLNKTKPQEYHHSHHHLNSYLSGVLYISCLPNDHIVLSNRSYGLFDNIEFSIKESTEWNATVITVNVKKGDLVLFPSWVPHNVDVNNTDKERISLSFDTFPIGELGGYGATILEHLKL